ncbi:LytR/AlgR family response regulator transcription factor [Maribacter halichondriae]|uniref:LytR/AlgR family response regulator transcription factor n=1 Tax=Maribacter halichondriae TaxID=2980554 RepID=UPI002359B6D4|nr:LytTR family DNA-binding domain-containing protein [Maribacter sp. Hal144]
MEPTLLKVMVIDDSSVQRAAIVKFIENHPNLELTGEYHNGINARKILMENDTDLIFLDVEMPVLDGFQLLESLDHRPQIIIITSNPDHALQAFDYNVTDYLLKPIAKERFNESVKRAMNNHIANLESGSEGEHIYVNSNLKKVKVFINDVNWVEGFGDYVKIVTDDKNGILVLSTMKNFIKKLPEDKFLRIHKSYIVNLEKVEKFNTALVEIKGTQLPLSRHKKDQLEDALVNG